MRSHADHRRRGRGGGGSARASRALRGALLASGLTAAVVALTGVVAGAAFKPRTVVVGDARGDVSAGPDITRVSLGRGSDGRVRLAITLAGSFSPGDLVARSGPPGSICLRVWTASVPPNTRPDHLVCVTTQANRRTLRGTVIRDGPGSLPRRVAAASVSRRGARALIVRFSQSAVGRPSLMRFAVEATRPGCIRISCVDTAPDEPKISRIRLREATARAPT